MKHYGFGSRLLAWLCVVIMLVMMLPLSAAADGDPADDETTYAVNWNVGEHGTVTLTANDVDYSSGEEVSLAADTSVTLTVTPEARYKLKEVSAYYGSSNTLFTPSYSNPASESTYTFKMPTNDIYVSVTFGQRESVTVSFEGDVQSVQIPAGSDSIVKEKKAEVFTDEYGDGSLASFIVTPAEHYDLPEFVTVQIGGTQYTTSESDSSSVVWNKDSKDSAVLSIPYTLLTADATVTVEGVEKPYVQFAVADKNHLTLGCEGKVYLEAIGDSEDVSDENAYYSLAVGAADHYNLSGDVKVSASSGKMVNGTWDAESGHFTVSKAELKDFAEEKETLYVSADTTPIEYEITVVNDNVNVSWTKTDGAEKITRGTSSTINATVEDTVEITLMPKSSGVELPEELNLGSKISYNVENYGRRTWAKIEFSTGSVKEAFTINLKTTNYVELKVVDSEPVKCTGDKDSNAQKDCTLTFTAEDGYTLPDDVTVKHSSIAISNVTGQLSSSVDDDNDENTEGDSTTTTVTEGYTWDQESGTLTILQGTLEKVLESGERTISITVTPTLNTDNYTIKTTGGEELEYSSDAFYGKTILIEPKAPATSIEVNYDNYEKDYKGVVLGCSADNCQEWQQKGYYCVARGADVKDEKLTYRLYDENRNKYSEEATLTLTVDTTKPVVDMLRYEGGRFEKGNYYCKDLACVTFRVFDTNFVAENYKVELINVANENSEINVANENSETISEDKISWTEPVFGQADCEVMLSIGDYADGKYKVKLTVTDAAGNEGSKISETLVIDTLEPEVSWNGYSVDEYKDGKYYTKDTVTVAFEATDTNFAANMLGEYKVTVTGVKGENSQTITDGVAWRGDVCTVTLNCADETQEMVNELADGEYTVALTVTDAAGHNGTAESETIVLDKNAPDVEVTSYKVNGVDFASYKETGNRYVNDSIAITFKVTEKNFDKDLFRFEGLPDTDGSYSESEWSDDGDVHTITLTLMADGTNDGIYNAIKLVGKDMADNDGEETTEPIVLDKTVPEIKSVTYEEKGGFKLLKQIWWWIAGKLNPDTDADGYSRTVKATVKISDDLSPIDGLDVLSLSSSEVKNLEVEKAEGTSATYTFEASPQFMEELKITATDAAGNTCGSFEVQKDENGKVTGSPNLLIDTYAPTIDFGTIDYSSVHSSNYPVTVTVTDPAMENVYSGLKQVTVSVHYQQSGTKVESGSINGYRYSDGVYTKKFESSDYTDYTQKTYYTQKEEFTVTLPVNLHSNLVYVEVTAEDNAGNTVTATSKDNGQYIKLDSVAPIVSVVYDNNSAQNSKYFMQSRTATITVTDNNFSADGMTINTQGTVGGWTATGATNDDGQQNVYTCTVSYASDADYTLNVTAADLGGNTTNDAAVDYSGQTAAQDFTVDLTDPTFTIGMVSGDAEIRSSGYSNQAVTVTLTVNEHNFDSSAATAGLTVIHEGVDISQSIRSSLSWSSNGDVRTASFVLTDDGEYAINLSFQDLAGNSTAVASDVIVYVDQTNPLVYVTGVADKSANAQREIVPVVTIWDKYYDGNSVEIRLRNGAGQDVTSKYLDMENDRSEVMYDEQRDMYYQTFTFKNITDDHVYHLEVRHTDLAGNTNTTMTVLNAKGEETVLDIEKEVMRFSVNRNGSTYSADDDTLEILGKYIQSAKNVRILEINVDELDPDSIYITLTHDNITRDLVNGDDYTYQVPPEQNEASWNVYEYVFADSLFADDGIYTISIYSVDAAGNVAQNNTEEKDFEITFVVDKTPPIFVAVNLEAGEIYNEEQHEVTINCSDNIAFDSVQVYRLDSTAEKDENGNYIWFRETSDGEMEMLCEPVELAAVEGSNGDYTFVIYEGDSAATSKQSVLVVCTDKAGNQNVEQEILDFTVSSSFWIRFYANKPLFYGSIGGISALLILAAILFLTKRREEK